MDNPERIVDEVSKLILEGKYTDAMKKVDNVLLTETEPKTLALFEELKARLLMLMEKSEKSTEHINKALSLLENIDDRLFKAQILISVAGLLLYMGDFHNALTYYKRAETLLSEDEYDYLRILNNIGETYKRMENLHLATEYFSKCYELAIKFRERGYLRPAIYASENLAEIYAIQGDKDKAREKLLETLPLAQEARDISMENYILLALAILDGEEEKVKEYSEKIGPYTHYIADVYYYFSFLADSTFAKRLLQEAIDIYYRVGDGNMYQQALKKWKEIE